MHCIACHANSVCTEYLPYSDNNNFTYTSSEHQPSRLLPPFTFTIHFCSKTLFHVCLFSSHEISENRIRCETEGVFPSFLLPSDVKQTSLTRHRWRLRWTIESKIKPLLAISDAGVLCSCQIWHFCAAPTDWLFHSNVCVFLCDCVHLELLQVVQEEKGHDRIVTAL